MCVSVRACTERARAELTSTASMTCVSFVAASPPSRGWTPRQHVPGCLAAAASARTCRQDASRGRSGPKHSGVRAFRDQGTRALKSTRVRTFPQGQQVPRPPGRACPPGGPLDQHVTLDRETTCAALPTNLPPPTLPAERASDAACPSIAAPYQHAPAPDHPTVRGKAGNSFQSARVQGDCWNFVLFE